MTHQRLYAPVWWDQPPGHPALLQAGAALFGNGVQSFRLVAGLLGASSLWALAACGSAGRAVAAVCDRRSSSGGSAAESAVADRRYSYRAGGFLAPFAAVLLCISSMGLLSYGLSVTIMLPALGFGLWAVWLWQRFGLSGNRWVLFASGIVFGLGFQTKFTVLLFLPALGGIYPPGVAASASGFQPPSGWQRRGSGGWKHAGTCPLTPALSPCCAKGEGEDHKRRRVPVAVVGHLGGGVCLWGGVGVGVLPGGGFGVVAQVSFPSGGHGAL